MSNKEFKVIGDPMDCLAEECAEVIKALMKIKRFGLEGHPGKPMKDGVRVSNRDELLEEMQDCEDRLNEVRAILGASRDSRMLSAVPSEREIGLVKKILAARKCLELSEFQKAWNELYLTPDERGIAG